MASQYLAALPADWRVVVTNDLPIYDTDPPTDPRIVRVRGGYRLRHVDLRVRRPGHRDVEVTFLWKGGRYVAHSIRTASAAGLSADDLTGLRLAALAVEADRQSWVEHTYDGDQPCWDHATVVPEVPASTRGPGSTIVRERLEVAASAWKQADADGGHKQQYVADALGLSRPQAGVYIKRAREAGLIPPRKV